MKKLLFTLLVSIMVLQYSCNDKCKDNEAPEINFGVEIRGFVNVKDHQGRTVTNQYIGNEFKAHLYKYYCDGKRRGPFEELFTIDSNSEMIFLFGGTWSFRMDNINDYLWIVFYHEGKNLGSYMPYYNDVRQYNGSVAVFGFYIYITLNESGSIKESRIELF